MRKGKAAAPSPPFTPGDNKAFPTPPSAYGSPPSLFFFFLVKYPTIRKFMATVEIHGATTFILVIFSLILSVSSISQFPPQNKFSAAPSGGMAGGPGDGPAVWRWSGRRRERRLGVQCSAAVAGALPYQLALTASMSLTRFWARHIPKICSNAMPMNTPATMVKLSCSHFSNWGTQPFV